MRVWLAFATLAASAAGVMGCQSSAFACQSNGACPEGRCEPQGWCSFPDASCSSGHRFGEHAAEGLAGTCVEITAGETEPGSTGPGTTTTADVSSTTEPAQTDTTSTTVSKDTADASSSSDPSSSSSSGGDTLSDSSTGPGRPTVVTVPIVADADDGAIYDTPEGALVWAQSGEDGMGNGFFGEYPDGAYYVAYFRFALPDEVDNATLIDARLRLEATSQGTFMWSGAHAVGIWLESGVNAPAVEGTGSFPSLLGGSPMGGVTLLDANVRWPDAGGLAWTAGANTSPDVAPLLDILRQDFEGLGAGDYVQFWLAVATPTGTGGEVTYVDFSSGASAVPELELTFAGSP